MPAGAAGIAWGALGIAPEPLCIVLSLCTFAPRALCMAPRALCIVLRLCTLLQGLCAWSQGLCTWLRGRMQCPGGLCIALGAMYTILGVLYTAPEASALLRGCERCSGGSVRSPWGSLRCSRACGRCSHVVYIAPGAPCAAVISQPHSETALAAAAAAPSRPASHCPQWDGCITATSQPPSASPRWLLTACVSGHTSISQGQTAQHRWPFTPRAPGRPHEVLVTQPWGRHCPQHQQPRPGSVPACCPHIPGTAAGILLLYIDPFGVVFSIFLEN